MEELHSIPRKEDVSVAVGTLVESIKKLPLGDLKLLLLAVTHVMDKSVSFENVINLQQLLPAP